MNTSGSIYKHNVLHAQAKWALIRDLAAVKRDDDYSYFVGSYLDVPPNCRVNVGYVLD